MSKSYLTPLNDARMFSVVGPDALTFLQGQLTADITQLDKTGHSLAAHCNVKGQMVGLFRVMFMAPDTYWLRVNEEIAETAFANLKKYSIFSKVELSFITQAHGFGASSDVAISILDMIQPEQELDTFMAVNDTAFCAINSEHVEIWTTDPRVNTTAKESLKGDIQDWLTDNIKAGQPDLRSATQEHFIPQMCNLQAVNGVSFTKGCYTGQEIVIRLQHRGILKKAMYPFELLTDEHPLSGDAILDSEHTPVGEVILSSHSEGVSYVLAVVQQAKILEEADLQVASGGKLQRLALPYELDPKMFESKR